MAERRDHDLTSDPLDRGLAAAFASGPAHPGVLDTLASSVGSVPRVLLPDTDAGFEGPLIKPASTEVPNTPGRYQLFGEIARGGMGAVLKGRDSDLGRDLAIKVLLEQHRDNPDFVRRFVEEAQIGGQLQHPGIVPVYELGSFPDRRPYFAMKLVKGRTLASLLAERKDSHDDLPRFLGIFEQVAQTVAYAHARGVIHRDLKPSNVMVGNFGEVQVMDWGLAKVLKEGGVADDDRGESAPVEVSVIRTVRSGSTEDGSLAGSVLGTPAYMAPEQARGDIERVDRRADVFGLGSILCEVLTGQPAYTGPNGNEIFRKALRGDTADACARLGTCGADADFIALASACLAPEPADRPRDAAAVAGRITAYLTGVQEKLRAAERERAVAEARAVEERRRRKLQVGLAATVLALTTVGGLSTTYYLQQRQARFTAGARILGEATTLRDQARAHPDDPARWHEVLASIRRVDDALGGGGAPETRRQSDALRDEARAGMEGAERDRRLLDRLVDIRSAEADDLYGSGIGLATDAAYADAFKEAGIDLAALSPADAGQKIKARPPATALALAAALDDWAAVRRRRRSDRAGAKRLSDAARTADPDPWRRDLRTALDQTEKTARLTALQATARSARFDERGAVSLDLLGTALESSGDRATAETVLRAAQRRHPGDVWVNYDLAQVCEERNQSGDAIRFYTAARSIRPESAHQLAHLLEQKGMLDEAIAVFQDLVRLRPRNGYHLICLGTLLKEVGRRKEAAPYLDAAVAAGRETIRLKPDDSRAHCNLGSSLNRQGKLDEAVAEFRAAIRLKPDDGLAHSDLGSALMDQGKLDEAVAELREAVRLEPDDAKAHGKLGMALEKKGRLDEAVAENRAAIRLDPNFAPVRNNLGLALKAQGKLDEAIAEFREAIRLRPDKGLIHENLGNSLKSQGKLDEAVAAYRAAIRLKPDDARAHVKLGVVLCDIIHDYDGAIAEFRAAIRLKPDDANAHSNLGSALYAQGKHDEAVAEYRTAIRLEPDNSLAHIGIGSFLCDIQQDYDRAIAEFREAIRLNPEVASAHFNLGNALKKQGNHEEAVAEYRAAIRLKPDDARAHNGLGAFLCDIRHDYDGAIAEFREAITLWPDLALAHSNLGFALEARGKREEAVAEYREAIRLKPDDAVAHFGLGAYLHEIKHDYIGASDEYREALRLRPDDADTHNNLGLTLADQRKYDEAVAEYRAAIQLKPDLSQAHYNLGNALNNQGKLDGAVAEYRAAIRLKPDDALAHYGLGLALKNQGKPNEAAAEYRAAIQLKPDHLVAHLNLGAILCDVTHDYEGAIAEFRTVIELKPNDARGHFNLGNALKNQRKFDEAVAAYRAAIRLRPDDAPTHLRLGAILCDTKHDYEGAIAEFRTTIRLTPNDPWAHFNLGTALRNQGKLDEAVTEFRAATRLNSNDPLAHDSLGFALKAQGKLEDALVAFRRAGALAKPGTSLARELPGRIGQIEQLIAVAGRLPAVLKGEDTPRGAAEGLVFGRLCSEQGRHAAAARLWADALAADPKLGDDRRARHRYTAACSAVLAGCGKSKDDPPPDEPARAALRQQALDWLKAERAAWAGLLEEGSPQTRATIAQTLKLWQRDANLAGIRDGEALAQLPEEEQKAWRDFWSDVETLLKKAQGDRP